MARLRRSISGDEPLEYLALGDMAWDNVFYLSPTEYKAVEREITRFEKKGGVYDADRAIRFAKNTLNHTVSRRAGGPVFNLAYHLLERGQKVLAMGVIGKNKKSSGRYLNELKDLALHPTLRTLVRQRSGKRMPEFVCFYADPDHQKHFWAGNVTEEVDNYNINGADIRQADVLILSVTNPDVSVRALYGADGSRDFDRLLVYNPGQLLSDMSVEEARVEDILPATHIFSANDDEMVKIQEHFGLDLIPEMFSVYENLEYILHTRKEGSTIYHNSRNRDEFTYIDHDVKVDGGFVPDEEIEDDIGPGDAYLAVTANSLLHGYSMADAARLGHMASADVLRHKGATPDKKTRRRKKKERDERTQLRSDSTPTPGPARKRLAYG